MKILKYISIFILFIGAGYYGLVFMAPKSIEFQVNEDFDAPIDKVFQMVANPAKLTQWNSTMDKVTYGGKYPLMVGDKYEIYFKGDQPLILSRTVQGFDQNQRLVTHGIIPNYFVWNEDIRFEALDSTHTRIFTKITLKSESLRTRLLMYAKETHEKNVSQNYQKLKKVLKR